MTIGKELPTTITNNSQVVNKLDLKDFSILHLNIATLIKYIDHL